MDNSVNRFRLATLIRRNLRHYWRTELAVVAGVGVAVAVLAGALLVGDSVRASLRDLFLLRLGSVDYAISSGGLFREGLARDIEGRTGFSESFRAACPILALEGVVVHQSSGRRALGVQVYGVDRRFWSFHQRAPAGPQGREILLSDALTRELAAANGDSVLVRLEKPAAIPGEFLHGRREDRGRAIRFSSAGALSPADLGDFSIRPQQGAVRAVFVPLVRLQKELEQPGRANSLLISEKSPAAGRRQRLEGRLEGLLREAFALEDLGIRIRALDAARGLSVESDGGLLSDGVAGQARAAAAALGLRAAPVFTYLANSIRAGGREIPYSLVAALDLEIVGAPGGAASSGATPPIVLNEWAARELRARPGEDLSLDYYLWQESGRLITRTAQFRLAAIVPLSGPAADPDLAPEYPGITDSDKLRDWDPPFPIDLRRIRPQDEAYWERYRATPKAFIPLEAGQRLWQSRFGTLTSVRILAPREAESRYRGRLREALDPLGHGFAIHPARAQGLEASRGATDFGQYFVYFSFFLVVSALLLTGLFFKLGVEQRLREVGALRALGFPGAMIRRLFVGEGLVLAAAGGLIGLAGGVGYAALLMAGLRTWWIDAVGTRQLALHVGFDSLAFGGLGGILTAFAAIVWTLRGLESLSPRSLLAGELAPAAARSARRLMLPAAAACLAALLLLLAARQGVVGPAAGFFGAGALLLAAALCFQYFRLARPPDRPIAGVARLGFRNAGYRPGRSILAVTLIASATFILVAVDSFRRRGEPETLDPKSGTGGFSLLAEALLPLYHDPNTDSGREALTLGGRPELDKVVLMPFRLRPGDDASCLNLYQPRSPRILAPPAEFLRAGRFSFQESLAATPEERRNPWLLLEGSLEGGAIPAVADANSITYILHRKLGDEVVVRAADGRPARLRLVGALRDSLFQAELLISETSFLRLFPDQGGYRFFLISAPAGRAEAAAGALEDALADYGLDAAPALDRLAAFHRVENTYLSTFQTLGGFGLLLGTLGLAAVLLRNVLERRRDLALLRAVGYGWRDVGLLVVAENALLLISGLAIGTGCAALATAPALAARGGQLPAVSLAVLLLAILATGLAASILAVRVALRSPLLPALRSE